MEDRILRTTINRLFFFMSKNAGRRWHYGRWFWTENWYWRWNL